MPLNLKLSWKLALIAISSTMPLLCGTFYLINKYTNKDIRFAVLEQEGIRFLQPLDKLLEALSQHQTLLLRSRAGDAAATAALAAQQAQTDRAFTALQAVIVELGPELQYSEKNLAQQKRAGVLLADLLREWQELKQPRSPLPFQGLVTRHARLLAEVHGLMTHIGNSSNLILDPEPDSYYLADLTLTVLPRLQNRLAAVSATGRELLAHPSLTLRERLQLAGLARQLKESDLDQLTHDAQTALLEDANFRGVSESLQRNLPPAVQAEVAATNVFVAMIDRMAESEEPAVSAAEFEAAGVKARNLGFQLWVIGSRELDLLLRKRVDDFNQTRTWGLGLVAASLLFSVGVTGLIAGSIKRVEQELLWRTALFEAQVDSALDGILVVDGAGKKVIQNRRLAMVWKIPAEIANDPDDARQLRFVVRRTRNPDQFAAKVAHLNDHPEETGRDEIELVDDSVLDRYSAPVRDKAGNYYGRIWTFRDITDQKRAAKRSEELQNQLLQSQKLEAIGTLAGGIAHDFNNILTGVLGNAELIAMDLKGDGNWPRYQGQVETMIRAGHRATDLVRQILTFSRQTQKIMEAIQLTPIAAECVLLLRAAVSVNIEIATNFALGLPSIIGDSTQIHQVIMNLSTNAVHAMQDRKGRLLLELDEVWADHDLIKSLPGLKTGPHIQLSVTDTGHGMGPETIKRIFEPFFTTKKMGEGTGLGLSVVHGIIQEHGGGIYCYSRIGEGTTFRCYIPVASQTGMETRPTDKREAPRGNGESILVIDDEVDLRTTVAGMLQRLGYKVHHECGAEALRLFTGNPENFNAVVTDLAMPNITGLELAGEILKLRPNMPIILTSGFAGNLTNESLRKIGIHSLLLKPITVKRIGSAVRLAIDSMNLNATPNPASTRREYTGGTSRC